MNTSTLSQSRLREVLSYDPETGKFTWIVSLGTAKVGSVTGCPNSEGYIIIGIDSMLYRAHRLAFLYMTGSIPIEVDHGNHNRSDNRWKNLNSADRKSNSRNSSMSINNTSGFKGVFWHEERNKWGAYISVDGKRIHLGLFTDKSDAIKARQAANLKYNYHPNHGENK